MIKTREEKEKRITYLEGRLPHLEARKHKENSNVVTKVRKQIENLKRELEQC